MVDEEEKEEKEAELKKRIDEVDDHVRVALNDDGTRTLVLARPISPSITELTFKEELTVVDLEEGDKGTGDSSKAARLIASATGVEYRNIRKMTISDFLMAGLIIGKMSGKDDETGGTS